MDEACSGIDSLYALAAVAIALVVWNRSSLAVGVATLATVPAWAWLGNSIRIVFIAFLLETYEIDLTKGWPHTILGLCIFPLTAISLLLTHELAKNLLGPFLVETVTTNSIHRWFNCWVLWPSISQSGRKARNLKEGINRPQEKSIPHESTLPLAILVPACAVCILVTSASFLPLNGIGPWNTRDYTLPSWTTHQVATFFQEHDLPAVLAA